MTTESQHSKPTRRRILPRSLLLALATLAAGCQSGRLRHLPLYEGPELRFDQAHCGIYLDGQALDTPIGRADPQTLRLLTDMAEQQLREADAETSLEGALRALLLDHLAAPPKLDDAARILNLSPRSLRRKLAESGTSYQGVLDAVRLAVASRLIRETDRPIAAIGYELGFTNPSDFGRAFKKWSGQPPSAYRQQA